MNTTEKHSAVIIGSGFASLSAACHLAKKGIEVTVYEKNEQTGGRARIFEHKGYRFDMGPSWYWMPDVFENFFAQFNKKVSDYYDLRRLSPSYQVFFYQGDAVSIPSSMKELEYLFESIEPGAGKKLQLFLRDAAFKYDASMSDLIYTSGSSITEYLNGKVLKGLLRSNLLTPFSKHARKYFKNEYLLQLVEFPVLFLGATPSKIPALYSLMNYADMQLGTWYPMGGMHKIVEAMTSLALSLGVKIELNSKVEKIISSEDGITKGIQVNNKIVYADFVVAGADYHHVEQELIEQKDRKYNAKYWDKRTLAPSCLIYYVGVKKKIKNLQHHNLFFDTDFNKHAEEIYTNPAWPSNPLFYVSCPSKTDPSVAPENCENLFILIPVAPALSDTAEIQEKYFNTVIQRIEKLTGDSIAPFIEYKRNYAPSNFMSDYNAFKGNAYGLANTLTQTAFLKPSIKSNKIKNLFFTGQLTVPGPGVPPAIISGEIIANEINKIIKNYEYESTI